MKAKRRAVIAVTFALLAAPAFAANPSGTWLTEDGEARVRIADCGQAYCGTIVWLKEPNDPQTGKPKLDKFNKHESMRSRRVLGMQIIYGMHPSGANSWKGSLYNPEDGNTFNGSLALQGADRLKLEGCVLALFCRSEVWKRVN
ncbi:MAG TPA: DUF2147 domain-containing protein [Xanthobacteraceae bacterium]|nr:DUF2147 domain-containing protein [Xanthobacteraceae bacterium]